MIQSWVPCCLAWGHTRLWRKLHSRRNFVPWWSIADLGLESLLLLLVDPRAFRIEWVLGRGEVLAPRVRSASQDVLPNAWSFSQQFLIWDDMSSDLCHTIAKRHVIVCSPNLSMHFRSLKSQLSRSDQILVRSVAKSLNRSILEVEKLYVACPELVEGLIPMEKEIWIMRYCAVLS